MAFSLKRAFKRVKKAADYQVKNPLSVGGTGPGTRGTEEFVARATGSKSNVTALSEAQKFAPGPGMARQLKHDIGGVRSYFNPEEPEFSPDPRIAAEEKEEAARRRNRRLGRAMLMTSRAPVTRLEV